MRAFAEAAFHPGPQGDAGLAEPVAHAIGGRKRMLPLYSGVFSQQTRLGGFIAEG